MPTCSQALLLKEIKNLKSANNDLREKMTTMNQNFQLFFAGVFAELDRKDKVIGNLQEQNRDILLHKSESLMVRNVSAPNLLGQKVENNNNNTKKLRRFTSDGSLVSSVDIFETIPEENCEEEKDEEDENENDDAVFDVSIYNNSSTSSSQSDSFLQTSEIDELSNSFQIISDHTLSFSTELSISEISFAVENLTGLMVPQSAPVIENNDKNGKNGHVFNFPESENSLVRHSTESSISLGSVSSLETLQISVLKNGDEQAQTSENLWLDLLFQVMNSEIMQKFLFE